MRISDWSSDVCSSDLDSRVVLLWGRPTPEEQTRLTQGALDFFRYTTKLVHARMEKLEDDYPSQLLRQRDGDASRATIRDIIEVTFNLLFAGQDRKSVVYGESVSVRVDRVGSRRFKKKQ